MEKNNEYWERVLSHLLRDLGTVVEQIERRRKEMGIDTLYPALTIK